MIIGIAANAMGVGKDTVADILCAQYDYVKLSFADELKREVQQMLTTKMFPPNLPDVCRGAALLCIGSGDINPFAKPTSDSMRIVLQQWGTEFRRAQDVNYWVKRVDERVNRIMSQTGQGNFVIPDMRFLNEMMWVKKQGGVLWFVDGPSRLKQGVQTKHASEGMIIAEMCDTVIFNHGSLEGLVQTVVKASLATPGIIPIPDILGGNIPYGVSA